ncbi:aldo/keto reductase [Dialister hominis]
MGASETILGEFVDDCDRDDLYISTKFTPQIAKDVEHPIETMMDESLKRLHTDYVDLYWIHNPADVERWTKEIIPVVKSGKARAVGVSNHNLEEIKRAEEILSAEGLHVAAVQNHYSLLHRSSERAGILDYCKEEGITFYAYMVLEQGALTGKYDKDHLMPERSGRGKSYNGIMDKLDGILASLKEIGEAHNITPSQTAIAWALAKGTLPIIGVTKVKQVEEAAAAMDVRLTEEEIQKLEQEGDKAGVHTLRVWEKDMD